MLSGNRELAIALRECRYLIEMLNYGYISLSILKSYMKLNESLKKFIIMFLCHFLEHSAKKIREPNQLGMR